MNHEQFLAWLKSWNACGRGCEFVASGQLSAEQTWAQLPRADWLLWMFGRGCAEMHDSAAYTTLCAAHAHVFTTVYTRYQAELRFTPQQYQTVHHALDLLRDGRCAQYELRTPAKQSLVDPYSVLEHQNTLDFALAILESMVSPSSWYEYAWFPIDELLWAMLGRDVRRADIEVSPEAVWLCELYRSQLTLPAVFVSQNKEPQP